MTELHDAIRNGTIEDVNNILMRKVPRINIEKKQHGLTALSHAIFYGKVEIAIKLLGIGAAVYATNKYGYTPLHLAAWKCHPDIVMALLKEGANVDARTNKDKTPLSLTKNHYNKPTDEELKTYATIADLLKQHGAK